MDQAGVATILLETTDSTSTHARRVVEAGRAMPFVVVARTQTAGRGQFSRVWSSPEGGLWCTLAWGTDAAATAPHELGQHIGEACLRTVEEVLRAHGAHAAATLKQPNDVLIDSRKVLGVLTETFRLRDTGLCVLVGVGINANFRREELPAQVGARATTLLDVTGRETDLGMLRGVLVGHLVAALRASFAEQER